MRFASELKSLLRDPAVPRELDPAALDDQLTFRFTPAPRTLLAVSRRSSPRPGCGSARAGAGSAACTGIPSRASAATCRSSDAAEEFRDRLRTAVRRQMMSDRPIGAMLSGGIDSAAVVAMMAESSSQVRTYTVGFEGGGDSDETALARATAELFDTDHHDLIVPAGRLPRRPARHDRAARGAGRHVVGARLPPGVAARVRSRARCC